MTERRAWRNPRRPLVIAAAAALAIYVALAVLSDARELSRNLHQFPWHWFPLVLVLTLGNYTGRLIKWIWYLRLVGAQVTARDATRMFAVAMSMVLTPGKAGELIKSYMVKNLAGTPMRVTAPIVLCERLTDGLAMVLLASLGLSSLGDARLTAVALAALAAMVGVVAVTQSRPLALWILATGERLPALGRAAAGLRDFYESSYTLLRPRNLLLAVCLGTVSWLCEGVAYYVVLVGVGVQAGSDALLSAIFIFSISSILGAVVATPGGIGGTDGALVTLGSRLLGLSVAGSTAAAFVVRFATLWFGVAIGVFSMALWPDLMEERLPPAAASKT